MMITLRARIFIFISIIVLLIIGISLLIIVMTRKGNATPPATGTEATTAQNDGVANAPAQGIVPTPVAGLAVRPQPTLDAQKNAVKQLARLFIERYNSFSSNNEWVNITEVKDLVTADVWSKISQYIGKNSGGTAVAVVTQAVSVSLSNWQDTSATVLISTVRDETRNSVTQHLQKNYQVEMLKVGEQWLVNKFEVVK